jgi:DNA-binding PadR family transcriptional regulator
MDASNQEQCESQKQYAHGIDGKDSISTREWYTIIRYMSARRPLSPQVFQILLSLAERPRHGYAIILEIQERTASKTRLTASTLYAALKRLLDAGLVAEVAAKAGDSDPRRRYYRLTPSGVAAGRAEAARLDALTTEARARRWLPARHFES